MFAIAEVEIQEPVHPAASAVGIDLGIARFATFSIAVPWTVEQFQKAGQETCQKTAAIVRQGQVLSQLAEAEEKNHAIVCIYWIIQSHRDRVVSKETAW